MSALAAAVEEPRCSRGAGSLADDLLEQAAAQLRRAGIDRPLFEAQLLLAHVLGISRGALIIRWPVRLDDADRCRWIELVNARAERRPMAYLRGLQEFFGLVMKVSPDVLVPRPETELLVERALVEAERLTEPVIVDACTGSGCVAAALAGRLAQACIVAADISETALRIARLNIREHAISGEAQVVGCSTLCALRSGVADIVTANPPYIASREVALLQPEVRDYEPRMALDGGPDGLAVVRELLPEARRVLKPGGLMVMEVALGQAACASELFALTGFAGVAVHNDLAGIPRAVEGRKPSAPHSEAGWTL